MKIPFENVETGQILDFDFNEFVRLMPFLQVLIKQQEKGNYLINRVAHGEGSTFIEINQLKGEVADGTGLDNVASLDIDKDNKAYIYLEYSEDSVFIKTPKDLEELLEASANRK
jgi:hypothetical protein